MKSLGIGTSGRFRIAAAAVVAAVFLFSTPAAALDSYDFGDVEVGSESTVGLDIENLSPSSELTFSLSLESEGQAGFSLKSPEVTIPAGGISQIQVAFSPTAVGAAADTLQVFYMTFLVREISLQGNGIEAMASVPDHCAPLAAALQRWASAIAAVEYEGMTIGDRVQECIEPPTTTARRSAAWPTWRQS